MIVVFTTTTKIISGLIPVLESDVRYVTSTLVGSIVVRGAVPVV